MWLSSGAYSRDDVESPIAGSLEEGFEVNTKPKHCGKCPKNQITVDVECNITKTSSLTKNLALSLQAEIKIVEAKLEGGLSWNDGDSTTISGSASIPVDPCYYQYGKFVFEYWKEKGVQVTHSYSGGVSTSSYISYFYPNCRVLHSSYLTCTDNVTSVSTNKGDYYHSATASWESTEGGKCEGCIPGV